MNRNPTLEYEEKQKRYKNRKHTGKLLFLLCYISHANINKNELKSADTFLTLFDPLYKKTHKLEKVVEE